MKYPARCMQTCKRRGAVRYTYETETNTNYLSRGFAQRRALCCEGITHRYEVMGSFNFLFIFVYLRYLRYLRLIFYIFRVLRGLLLFEFR